LKLLNGRWGLFSVPLSIAKKPDFSESHAQLEVTDHKGLAVLDLDINSALITPCTAPLCRKQLTSSSVFLPSPPVLKGVRVLHSRC